MDSFSHPSRSKNGGGVIQGRPVGSLLPDRVNPSDSHRRSTRFGQCIWEDNPQHTLEETKTQKKGGGLSHSQNTTGRNQAKKTIQLQACSTFHEKAKMTPRVALEPREQSLRTQKIIPRLCGVFFPSLISNVSRPVTPSFLQFSPFLNENVYNCYSVPDPVFHSGSSQLIFQVTRPQMKKIKIKIFVPEWIIVLPLLI